MKTQILATTMLIAAVSITAASAQISIPIPLPGTGGTIQIGPQQNQDRQYDRGTGFTVRVLGATYGGNCGAQSGNVTQDLSRNCEGRNYCVYRVDYRALGDPRPGCAKEYHARYACRDGTGDRFASVRAEAHGQSVILDCRR